MIYVTQNVANNIRSLLKIKNINMKVMLSDIGLGINTISELSKGKQLSCISLAKIADYLDVSVDYLLGRTNIPDVSVEYISDNKTSGTAVHTVNGNNNIIGNGNSVGKTLSQQCEALVGIFEKLNVIKQAKLLAYADELQKEI